MRHFLILMAASLLPLPDFPGTTYVNTVASSRAGGISSPAPWVPEKWLVRTSMFALRGGAHQDGAHCKASKDADKDRTATGGALGPELLAAVAEAEGEYEREFERESTRQNRDDDEWDGPIWHTGRRPLLLMYPRADSPDQRPLFRTCIVCLLPWQRGAWRCRMTQKSSIRRPRRCCICCKRLLPRLRLPPPPLPPLSEINLATPDQPLPASLSEQPLVA